MILRLTAALIFGLLALGCLYYGVRFFRLLSVSKVLIESAKPYATESNDGISLLVLGDSTAVGVGAGSPEQSLPGRVASYTQAGYVENHAVSGAKVEDLSMQIAQAKRTRYDLILVQIGANDIVRFHSVTETARMLARELESLPDADSVLVMSAGDVGSATIFPPGLTNIYTKRTLAQHQAFEKAIPGGHTAYVNLYLAPRNRLFKEDSETYLAADGFHPSGAGYDIWFEQVAPYLDRFLKAR